MSGRYRFSTCFVVSVSGADSKDVKDADSSSSKKANTLSKEDFLKLLQQPQLVQSGRYALTFGEQAEHHRGGTILGQGLAKAGFSVAELVEIGKRFDSEPR